MAMNIDSQTLTSRIGRLRLKRCGSVPALTVFVAYAPTSDYDNEEVEAFYVELEKFYKKDHTFTFNVDEEYDRFVHHLHDSAKGAESLKTTKRRLSPESLELIRQRGAARASGNFQLTSELAKLCREAIKEDLNERRAEVLADAAEAGLSILNARRNFANFMTKMTALRRPDGIVTSSRRTMEKVIHDFYSDLFDSHVHHAIFRRMDTSSPLFSLPTPHLVGEERTAPGPDRIRAEHLKNLPPALIDTLARLFTRYLSECKVPSQWKTSKTPLLCKKGDVHDIGSYHPICLLSVVYKMFTRVILNGISKTLDEGQPCKQGEFRRGFSTIDHTLLRSSSKCRESTSGLCALC
ncbi:unnamed protein product [Heligmosomoides polygyrus]|uniref:Reverse transcriptase domain-containing protein n=1 Tax=Heligmosomoides polygyrus TaxID=6339 RepID=A0A183GL08_HELPZ|nr:unnamed protein product [Heligmosomoides polygyrus]